MYLYLFMGTYLLNHQREALDGKFEHELICSRKMNISISYTLIFPIMRSSLVVWNGLSWPGLAIKAKISIRSLIYILCLKC